MTTSRSPLVLIAAVALTSLGTACGNFVSKDGEPGLREVGRSGGTLTEENVSLNIPEGALASAETLEIREAPEAPEGHIGTAFEFLPDGTQFAVPVEVVFSYADVTLPEDLSLDELEISTVVDGEWEALPDSVVDPVAQVVRATTTHFSFYGMTRRRCRVDAHCDDGNPCTEDRCQRRRCVRREIPDCQECRNDADCDAGTVCELSTGCEAPSLCVPGCHEDSQCAENQTCAVPSCFTCPCPGECVDVPDPGCREDADCEPGTVCEPGTGCEGPNSCVPGCHDDSQCGRDEICNQVQCVTCPCPGNCEPAPDPGCRNDADCEAGTVCEPGTGCEGPNSCVPGCHDDSQCARGETCAVPACFTCPCPGECVAGPDPGCREDADCAPGTVCEPGTGCEGPNSCVPGCHDDSQCGRGEHCNQVQCITCPCPGQCEADPDPGCRNDGDCAPGTVCELGTGCEAPSSCVPGCHDDSQCAAGQTCAVPSCVTCPCPGECVDLPDPGCRNDADCGPGTVCEPGTGCTGPNSCVRGCHEDSQCGEGEVCNQVQCITCPCPGQCESAPNPGCRNDADCDPGTVCEMSTGCEAPATCVPGCRDNDDCAEGEACAVPACFTCPCPGTCHGDTEPQTCRDNGDCAPGTVCELGSGCTEPRSCVPGCQGDSDCVAGESCVQVQCVTCPCPALCQPTPPPARCNRDSDCASGTVCEFGTGCSGDKSCVPGCHEDSQCAPGQVCNPVTCITCPCPGTCGDR